MKLINDLSKSVPVSQMVDGDVAVIRKWHYANHVGLIIQRYKNTLIILGKDSGKAFTSLLDSETSSNGACMVEILEEGAVLEL